MLLPVYLTEYHPLSIQLFWMVRPATLPSSTTHEPLTLVTEPFTRTRQFSMAKRSDILLATMTLE